MIKMKTQRAKNKVCKPHGAIRYLILNQTQNQYNSPINTENHGSNKSQTNSTNTKEGKRLHRALLANQKLVTHNRKTKSYLIDKQVYLERNLANNLTLTSHLILDSKPSLDLGDRPWSNAFLCNHKLYVTAAK
jgi:hypothetical protein